MRAYFAQGRSDAAVRTYERCAAALVELGLRTSAWLDEVYAAGTRSAAGPRSAGPAGSAPAQEELRAVTVLAASVAASPELVEELGLEAVSAIISGSLAAVGTEVEALGGTVTAVSGGGLQALFGAQAWQAADHDTCRQQLATAVALARELRFV